MCAKSNSAVQQSACLEALDDYMDFYEDDSLRKCLLDEHDNRLKDAEGNLKTITHKFAVYCDNIFVKVLTPSRSSTNCSKLSSADARQRAFRLKPARRNLE